MRLRADDFRIAGWKRVHDLHSCTHTPEEISASEAPAVAGGTRHVAHMPDHALIEAAQPGDVWRVIGPEDQLLGYALTCPRAECDQGVHDWTHAYDCGYWPDRECKAGPGRTSCWEWTGSPEAGDLTASPSLHCVAERGGCGFHGWLKNGVLAE